MKQLLNWKPSLLTSFSIIGAAITAVIGIVFALGLEYQLEQYTLRKEADIAADQVALIMGPNLSLADADLSAPLDPAHIAQIDERIRQGTLYEQHIVLIKIWNRDGLLLYSDEKSMIGKYYPMSNELKEALNGEIATSVSSLNKTENGGERGIATRLLEIYVPMRLTDSDQIAGAYEIYHDLAVLEPSIADMRRFVGVSVGLSFLILYGSLFSLIRRASLELFRRSEENKLLYEQEQTRRAELAALYGLSRALAEAYDFDAILEMITLQAVETVRVTFCCAALLEDDGFVIRAASPVRILDHNLKVIGRKTHGPHAFYQQVLEQDTPIVITADSPDLSDDDRQALFLGLAETLCLLPLRAGERALGILIFGEARSNEREPFSPDKIRLARSIGDQAASTLYRVELFAQLKQSYLDTVLALANAVDAKDTYTADHAQRLADMALALGRELGMTGDELDGLRYGAILHDIGKIGIPDAVLKKPSDLNPAEWAVMRQHPSIGARILAPVPYLVNAAQIVRHHHERYDGTGYPDGLAGKAIPLGARILTVVDSYSAITDKRDYKDARSHNEAVTELRKHAGTQFDPNVVEVFLAIINKRGMFS